jgi:parvulin-like peptidyl-prolyl isomerase
LHQADDIQESLERLEKELLINKLLERTYNEKIRLSEEEIQSYYDQNITDFQIDADEVRIQHILLSSRADANLALQEINAGNSFESVAKARSIDAFAQQGGEMGFIRSEDVIPEIQRIAFRLSKDQVSTVIRSSYGYHIIKVLDKRSEGDTKPLTEVRTEIMQRLRVVKEGQVYYDLLYQLQNQNKYYVFQPPIPAETADSVETSLQEIN